MERNNLVKAKEILKDGNYTCVLYNGVHTLTTKLRGIKPLVLWYETSGDFTDYAACDKVIGKGAAFLYVLLKIRAVYAYVISKSALKLLEDNNIYAEYNQLAENIVNRKGDGICPFEEAVLNVNDEKEAYKVIRNKMIQMNILKEE